MRTADKDQQESSAVAGKPHNDAVYFNTCRNFQRHRAVLPAIARLSCLHRYNLELRMRYYALLNLR